MSKWASVIGLVITAAGIGVGFSLVDGRRSLGVARSDETRISASHPLCRWGRLSVGGHGGSPSKPRRRGTALRLQRQDPA
jgi:hypothetical protein